MPATRPRRIVKRSVMALAVVVMVLNGYVGSYPLALKLQSIQATNVPGGRPDWWISIYAPLERLIDNSAVGPAILKCLDAFGPEARNAQVIRLIRRDLERRPQSACRIRRWRFSI